MNTYTFYWKTGDRDVAQGPDVRTAFASLGYAFTALAAVAYTAEGDDESYTFCKTTHKWIKKPELTT